MEPASTVLSISAEIPSLAWVNRTAKREQGDLEEQILLIDNLGRCWAVVHCPVEGEVLYWCDLRFPADDRYYIDLKPAKHYCTEAVSLWREMEEAAEQATYEERARRRKKIRERVR